MHDCLIAFGSNVGHSNRIFEQTVAELDRLSEVRVSTISRTWLTEPVGGPLDQHAYLNAALRIQTTRSVFDLHQCLVTIESQLGRIRHQRWGPRKIDLDLILFDQLNIQTENLTVPHPRMSFRRFVLEPAVEIAGQMVHDPSGCTLEQLLRHLNETDDLIVYVGQDDASDPLLELKLDLGAPWKFQRVTPDEVRGFESRAKLATYTTTKPAGRAIRDTSEFFCFHGPSLELPIDFESAQMEIEAAIAAMTPWQPQSGPSERDGSSSR